MSLMHDDCMFISHFKLHTFICIYQVNPLIMLLGPESSPADQNCKEAVNLGKKAMGYSRKNELLSQMTLVILKEMLTISMTFLPGDHNGTIYCDSRTAD